MEKDRDKKNLLKEIMTYLGKQYLEENNKRLSRKDYKEIQRRAYSAVYWALSETIKILEDDSLDDFQYVEAIVKVYENLGLDCGGRYDFG